MLHANCTALTKCVNGGIRLEVYLDDGMKASGKFYTDDGLSFLHETNDEFNLVSFEYASNTIKGTLDSDPRKYGWPKTQVIAEVYVYGMNGASPSSIWQGGKSAEFKFEDKVLKITMPALVYPDYVDLTFHF